jgi:uncharacterized protein YegL
MSKHYTVLVLDASGSMGSMRDEAMDAFNEQLKDIRKATKDEGIQSRVGFLKFASGVQTTDIWNKPIAKVKNLQKSDYQPGGMTAMLDGVGAAIDKLMELDDIEDEATTVLINIISDGHENNSKKYSFDKIASRIKELTANGRWTFTYSGANQDLSVLSERMSIPKGNMLNFVANSKGLKRSTNTRSMGMSNYFDSMSMARDSRASGETISANVSNFYSSVTEDKEDSDKKSK